MRDTSGEAKTNSCDIFQWNPSHGGASISRTTRTYQQQLRTDTGCCLKDLLEVIDDRDEWKERVREIHASRVI